MKQLISFGLLILLFGCQCRQQDDIDCVIERSEQQLEIGLKKLKSNQADKNIFPRTYQNNTLRIVPANDWTSGFFAGNLWMMYELSGKEKWKKRALEYTLPLEGEQWNGNDHDIGFKIYSSFGKAIKYYDNQQYKDILIQSAKTLSTRYNPIVGCIRSWNSNEKTSQWKFPVIIDNMMNLELLLWAAKETGNESFKEIAIKHAQTTLKNHFRDDYSSYHVVDYDPETGQVLRKCTHQGFNDESSWARGQAWGLYGFTVMYRETGMNEFLVQAENIANYIINQNTIKQGKVPLWDFSLPANSKEPYDASAAAIISAALFQLAELSDNNVEYISVAQKLLHTLSSPQFFAWDGDNGGFLLKHSTGSKPFDSEVDVPLVYADYYFLESIIKSKKYGEKESLTLSRN